VNKPQQALVGKRVEGKSMRGFELRPILESKIWNEPKRVAQYQGAGVLVDPRGFFYRQAVDLFLA
jgi:hypothetical protein